MKIFQLKFIFGFWNLVQKIASKSSYQKVKYRVNGGSGGGGGGVVKSIQ
jgi:hypothetical protein